MLSTTKQVMPLIGSYCLEYAEETFRFRFFIVFAFSSEKVFLLKNIFGVIMEFKGVSHGVTEYLREMIICGSLKPEEKLNEEKLASYFGISRHPIREAFRILEPENLVVSIPRKGCYVSGLSIEDMGSVYRSREMIECFAFETFERKGIRRLPEVAKSIDIAASKPLPDNNNGKEYLKYLELFQDFHQKLVEMTDNYWAVSFYKLISPSLSRYQFISKFFVPNSISESIEMHKNILKILENGDYEKAKETMRAHIRNAKNHLEKIVNTRLEIKSTVYTPNGNHEGTQNIAELTGKD